MAPSITAAAVLLVAACGTAVSQLHPLSDEFISLINSKQNSWSAGRNFPIDTSMAYIKGLTGVLWTNISMLPAKVHDPDLIASLPEHFDPREKWPNCPTLNDIRDQGYCSSSWAHAAVEAMTDRVCTYSNGKKHFYFSAQDLVSCCTGCSIFGLGCQVGGPLSAWEFWRDTGLVSGGSFNSSEGCMPYKVEPCSHYIKGKLKYCEKIVPVPACEQQCLASYNVEYKKDKHYGKNVYRLSGEDNIKAELYKNGPVETVFGVFSDFIHYKSGVYKHTHGYKIDNLAVKMMGWGEEGGMKYWLMANSWNSEWGDNGFFKIRRGTNECYVEEYIVAGEPVLDML